MNNPVASCMVCGHEKELAVWVDTSVTNGKYYGVCFSCRGLALSSEDSKKENTDKLSCGHEACFIVYGTFRNHCALCGETVHVVRKIQFPKGF